MAEGVPITNTLFPPPPGYYKAFTPEAVARLAELRGEPKPNDADSGENDQLNPATPGELEELAGQLDAPRADWVLEEGRWMLFGQMYTAEPHIPNAKDIGLPALVADPVSAGGDSERAALPVLLQSFLHTLLALIDVLTGTSRVPDELERMGRASQGDQYIQHLSNLAATMMVSANQLRGVQAETTLVMLMEKQLEERRVQTEKLRAKSREVRAMIKRLRESSAAEVAKGSGKKADEAEQKKEGEEQIESKQEGVEGLGHLPGPSDNAVVGDGDVTMSEA